MILAPLWRQESLSSGKLNNLQRSHSNALNFALYLWWPLEILSIYRSDKTCLYPFIPGQPQVLGQIKQWKSAVLMSHNLFNESRRVSWLFLPAICSFGAPLTILIHQPLLLFLPFGEIYAIGQLHFWGQGCIWRWLHIFFKKKITKNVQKHRI